MTQPGSLARGAALVAIALVGLCSCIATRVSLEISPTERERIAHAAVPPLVALQLEPGAWTNDRSENDASELRALLLATGYFREVDVEAQLHAPPDVLVADVYRSRGTLSHFGGDFVSAFTLSVVPVVKKYDETLGLTLASLDESEWVDVQIDYESTEIFGWVALVLIPLPGWQWFGPNADLVDRLRIELLDAQPALARISRR